jgi:hypothetical protein
MPLPPELQPTPLELVSGVVVGWSPPAPLPAVPPGLTPLEALEEALAPSLARGACFVAFSGGRDSSAMLAVAVHAARRRGLPAPVAITMRFPGAALSDESEWQQEVVDRLEVEDWRIVELSDELDFLGATARGVLSRHGALWPPNIHAYAPLLGACDGGTLVTGMDGDGLFDTWQWRRVAAVLGRRRRPVPRDAARVLHAYAPAGARRAVIERRHRPFAAMRWLTPEARRAATRTWARYHAAEPRSWARRLDGYLGRRHLTVLRATLDMLAAERGATMLHPLMDPRFLAALARHGGRTGFADRTEAMTALFAGLLPERTLTRRSKADFSEVFWGPGARRFAEEWDGSGLDPALVDPAALRAEWLAPKPDARAGSALQAAWLATSPVEAQERVDGAVE